MRASKIDHGKPYESDEISQALLDMQFERQSDGYFLKRQTPVARKRGRPDVSVELREKPDGAGKERVYLYVGSEPFGALGSMVYAPEQADAENLVRAVRDWMKARHLL